MKRFYKLGVDHEVADQWHLAQPENFDGVKLLTGAMWNGQPWDMTVKLRSRIYSNGRRVSFSLGGLGEFFLSEHLMNVLRSELSQERVQGIPVEIDGTDERYEILNVLDIVDCLDEKRSGLSWRTSEDGVKSYAVNVLRIDPNKAEGHDLFRVKTWPVALVCSERIRDLLIANGVTGIRFTEVS